MDVLAHLELVLHQKNGKRSQGLAVTGKFGYRSENGANRERKCPYNIVFAVFALFVFMLTLLCFCVLPFFFGE